MKAVAKPSRYPRSPVLDITVTQRALTGSIERNSSHCVIADSIKETVPWASKVSVDLQTIRLTDRVRRLRYAYLTPRSCQAALVAFDQGRRDELHPFRFKLSKAHIVRIKEQREGAQGEIDATKKPRRKSRAAKRTGNVPMPPAQATLVSEHGPNSVSGTVPRRVGGRLPPKLSASSRREFGMRGYSIGYPIGSPERPKP